MKRSLWLPILAVSTLAACKSSTSPNDTNSNSVTGTIVFEEAISSVATESLASGASQVRFPGEDPSWAPDGRIVYAVDYNNSNDGHEHIMIANPDGTGAQSLADMLVGNTNYAVRPHLSPNGQYVAFNYYEPANPTLGTSYGTALFTTTGTSVGVIEGGFDGSWAPDNSLVLSGTLLTRPSTLYHPAPGLYHIDPTGQNVTPIGSGLTDPMWPAVSPDGTRIAFVMNSHVWLINMNGTGLHQLTSGPNEESYPTWSPDGKSIAAVSYGSFQPVSGTAVCVVSASATTPVDVSPSSSNYIQDKNAGEGALNPVGNIDWKK